MIVYEVIESVKNLQTGTVEKFSIGLFRNRTEAESVAKNAETNFYEEADEYWRDWYASIICKVKERMVI